MGIAVCLSSPRLREPGIRCGISVTSWTEIYSSWTMLISSPISSSTLLTKWVWTGTTGSGGVMRTTRVFGCGWTERSWGQVFPCGTIAPPSLNNRMGADQKTAPSCAGIHFTISMTSLAIQFGLSFVRAPHINLLTSFDHKRDSHFFYIILRHQPRSLAEYTSTEWYLYTMKFVHHVACSHSALNVCKFCNLFWNLL